MIEPTNPQTLNIQIKNRHTSRTQDSLFIAIEDHLGRVFQRLIDGKKVGLLGYSDMCLLLADPSTDLTVTFTEVQSDDGLVRSITSACKFYDTTEQDLMNESHIPAPIKENPSDT